MNYYEIKQTLEKHRQQQLLRFYGELSSTQQEELLDQIGHIDWTVFDDDRLPEKGEISPICGLSTAEIMRRHEEYSQIGKKVIQEGKVAAVLLAGGQGTRLGSSAPKGAYDIGLTHSVFIFERLIANLKEVCFDCGVFVPLLIMTSDKNDVMTREFLKQHDYFGYPEEFIRFFVQEMSPCTDLEGNILLEERWKLALSPNGNGGWYSSMDRVGLLKEFCGVEWFNVFSVDNVLQKIADPVFLGATIANGCMSGSKVVRKTEPHEKVGVLCLRGGLPDIVEYYELTEDMANARRSDGELLYGDGVILNYLFNANKLKEIAAKKIPVHRVKKKVAHLDKDGKCVVPEKENAYKYETLILDMIRFMGSCLPFEVEREKEFAPIKNLEGVDSVESARQLLQKNGIEL